MELTVGFGPGPWFRCVRELIKLRTAAFPRPEDEGGREEAGFPRRTQDEGGSGAVDFGTERLSVKYSTTHKHDRTDRGALPEPDR